MIATLHIDSPPNSNRSQADAANLFINLFDGTGRDYDVSLNIYRRIEPAVQLSDFVGRYVRQEALIDMTLNAKETWKVRIRHVLSEEQ